MITFPPSAGSTAPVTPPPAPLWDVFDLDLANPQTKVFPANPDAGFPEPMTVYYYRIQSDSPCIHIRAGQPSVPGQSITGTGGAYVYLVTDRPSQLIVESNLDIGVPDGGALFLLPNAADALELTEIGDFFAHPAYSQYILPPAGEIKTYVWTGMTGSAPSFYIDAAGNVKTTPY